MTVVAVTSAKSPGVTTTTLALANTWAGERLLVAECDMAGATMMSGYRLGEAAPEGLTSVARRALRGGLTEESLRECTVDLSGQGLVKLLPGMVDHAHSRNVMSAGPQLASMFRQLGQGPDPVDVLVDSGRLGTAGFLTPVLAGSDVVIIVVKPHRADLVMLAARVPRLIEQVRSGGGAEPAMGIALVGARGYTRSEVDEYFGQFGLKVWGELPEDRDAAAFFAGEAGLPRGGLGRSPLVRAAAGLAANLQVIAEQRARRVAGSYTPSAVTVPAVEPVTAASPTSEPRRAAPTAGSPADAIPVTAPGPMAVPDPVTADTAARPRRRGNAPPPPSPARQQQSSVRRDASQSGAVA